MLYRYLECPTEAKKEEVIKEIVYLYIHEMGHCMFRFYIIDNKREILMHNIRNRLLHYINEYYADIWGLAHFSKDDAYRMAKAHFDKIGSEYKKDSYTHPSCEKRLEMISNGMFDSKEIVEKVYKEIIEKYTLQNKVIYKIIRKKDEKMLRIVKRNIVVFANSHPDICMNPSISE